MMHERIITENYHKRVHACSCDFFQMWNRVKYAMKTFMADKNATSNFRQKNDILIVRSTPHQEVVTSGEKYVTSGKIVRGIRDT